MPIGLSFFLEVSLFRASCFLVARLGKDYVAAQQVVISLTGVIYMITSKRGARQARCGWAIRSAAANMCARVMWPGCRLVCGTGAGGAHGLAVGVVPPPAGRHVYG